MPVKLIWTREEDMTHCAFHPITQCKMTGAFDANNNLVGLHMRISGQSISASLAPQNLQNGMDPVVFQGLNAGGTEGTFGYNIPNVLIDHAMRNTHLTAGFWRGVNVNHNTIYVECFIDELAKSVGQDPLEFRRKLLKPKQLAVLNACAEKIGYDKPPPQGVFRGMAQNHAYASYVAAIAEVSITDARPREGPPHRGGDGFRLCGQSGADRAAGRGLLRVRALGAALRRDHRQGRRRRADITSTPTT